MRTAIGNVIDSGMVNDYIREATGGDYTSKDLRTWMGTVHCVRALKAIGSVDDEMPGRTVVAAIDQVAKALATRAQCAANIMCIRPSFSCTKKVGCSPISSTESPSIKATPA
jgi:DNA topoisomerase IB